MKNHLVVRSVFESAQSAEGHLARESVSVVVQRSPDPLDQGVIVERQVWYSTQGGQGLGPISDAEAENHPARAALEVA